MLVFLYHSFAISNQSILLRLSSLASISLIVSTDRDRIYGAAGGGGGRRRGEEASRETYGGTYPHRFKPEPPSELLNRRKRLEKSKIIGSKSNPILHGLEHVTIQNTLPSLAMRKVWNIFS